MKYDQQVKGYLKSAKQGSVLAQKQLGLLLTQKDSTIKDGIAWLEKAAATDAEAMYLLGKVYLKKIRNNQLV